MFYVNQVMRFGKLIAVFQPNPADAKSTITTVVIALAVGSSTLDQKKKYEERAGAAQSGAVASAARNSSFNTGESISAGLPSYVRNRIRRLPEFSIAANCRPTDHNANGPPLAGFCFFLRLAPRPAKRERVRANARGGEGLTEEPSPSRIRSPPSPASGRGDSWHRICFNAGNKAAASSPMNCHSRLAIGPCGASRRRAATQFNLTGP